MKSLQLPIIIQGGMGVGVSGWRLARAVSQTGQLGVVSGTAIDVVMARRLQLGDPGGHLRRSLAKLPLPGVAERILARHFEPGGKSAREAFSSVSMIGPAPTRVELELVIAANFVEVYLAREGRAGPVGVNYLEKIQTPTLASLFGAMLAGVDFVLMGAGIPRTIPGVLDRLSRGEPVELPLQVDGAGRRQTITTRLDPSDFVDPVRHPLPRPRFLAIVASATLASVLLRKASGRIDGFVAETSTAGGHNTPPRGTVTLDPNGEPVYGERDVIDIDAFRSLGVPFWLAGSYGTPERVQEALELGAAGVQVGTAFAFCEESGLSEDIKESVLRMVGDSAAEVFTDPVASSTGFPFKILQLEDSVSEEDVYLSRERVCDLGFLRQWSVKPNGRVVWRCPGEPVRPYVNKGGLIEDTQGRKCICNGLFANIGLSQVRKDGRIERPLVTCGNDLSEVRRLSSQRPGARYTARDVVSDLETGGLLTAARGRGAVSGGGSAGSVRG